MRTLRPTARTLRRLAPSIPILLASPPILRLPSISILLPILLLILASPAAAQGTGTVAGRAVGAEDGAAVPLSLVRLRAERGDTAGRRVLTGPDGAFRFDSVAPGEYRLTMERIGYTSRPSPAFRVGEGETVEQTLRAVLVPVALEGVTTVGNACYTAETLAQAPDLETLWREAQKSAETRRGFGRQYAFRYDRRIRGVARVRLLRDPRVDQDTTVYAHPDTAAARDAERRAIAETDGYASRRGGDLRVSVPSDTDLLEDDFLRSHCLLGTSGEAEDGALELRFRPVRRDDRRVDIRGVIRLEPGTFVVRELEFEYLRRGRPWARAALEYADVRTPYGTIRLPAGGTFRGRPGGTVSIAVSEISGTIEFTGYRDFERIYQSCATGVRERYASLGTQRSALPLRCRGM